MPCMRYIVWIVVSFSCNYSTFSDIASHLDLVEKDRSPSQVGIASMFVEIFGLANHG